MRWKRVPVVQRAASSTMRFVMARKRLVVVATKLFPKAASMRREVEQARVHGDWERIVTLAESMADSGSALTTPGSTVRLALAYTKLQRHEDATRVMDEATARFPWSDVVAQTAAEVAMTAGDYPRALQWWERVTILGERSAAARSSRLPKAFPRRGAQFDWYEHSWAEVAQGWENHWSALGQEPSVGIYRRVLETLRVSDHIALAHELSFLAIAAHPRHQRLAFQVCDLAIRAAPSVGADAIAAQLKLLPPNPAVTEVLESIKRSEPLVDELVRQAAHQPAHDLQLIDALRHSGSEFVIRAGHHWDPRRIKNATASLAARDLWPEARATTDVLSAAAWNESRRFARRYASDVGVDAGTLARAVFHLFKNELVLKAPVDRLAKEIAAEAGDEPVYVELNSIRQKYLSSYPSSTFQALYLYGALRALGCRVFLVRFRERVTPASRRRLWRTSSKEGPTLKVSPNVAGLRPPRRDVEPAPEGARALVVPSGIRSVPRMLTRIPPAFVLNSGSALKEFAYDRSFVQGFGYAVHGDVHPPRALLAVVEIPTEVAGVWASPPAPHGESQAKKSPKTVQEVELSLASSTLAHTDWHDWLAEAIVPYFRALVEEIDALLESRGIDEVHIGDYLYPEPVLVASRVKARGGAVHLWPHSSNPVHVAFQDPAVVDRVHVITRSGKALWHKAHPGVEVLHQPQAMLDLPEIEIDWDPTEPLSIVVIGGRPVLRNLPILDIEAHDNLYRDFFSALTPLVDQAKVRVFFKPRGLSGENEAWLETVVGRTADWKRVLEHPRRLTLPNPVFVSVSVGSSALLEGISRGIPGMIVREFAVRDYLATDVESFEVLGCRDAIEHLARISVSDEWTALRDSQVERLQLELVARDDVDS